MNITCQRKMLQELFSFILDKNFHKLLMSCVYSKICTLFKIWYLKSEYSSSYFQSS